MNLIAALLCVAILTALVLGAWLATCTFRARAIKQDVIAIIAALDRIAHGVFEPLEIPFRSPEVGRIGPAVQALADQVQGQFEVLQDAAEHDPLTGMANRAHFQRSVERTLEQDPGGTLCCLMFIDIDGFKHVNDTLGHNIGDRLLQCVAERLKIATRPDEMHDGDRGSETQTARADVVKLGRFGGDEFVVFMSGLPSEVPARRVANRIQRVMVEPFELSTHVAGVSASVGLAFMPGDASCYSDLMRAADAAMYHAKRLGRNRIERFTPQLEEHVHREATLEHDLRDALARNEFELHFQPLYDCSTLKVSAAEALIRWRHPQRGLIRPAEFIPIAEKSNLICDIGEWVLIEATKTIARLQREGLDIRICINVSPQQLEHVEFISLVRSALIRAGARPALLEIEITESSAMRDCDLAADRLGRLAELGVSIAIDDFGTGYSNLASLIRLPVSRLKIDRSLLDGLTSRAEVRTLVQTIISMANGLGLHSVAEGVEQVEQLDLLSSMGCDVAQGYLLSPPVERAALPRLIRASGATPAAAAELQAAG